MLNNHEIDIHPSWKAQLTETLEQPYMAELLGFLDTEIAAGKTILPQPSEWFNALKSTAFDEVKVVILGQDPYPTPGHAHGLCFSVHPDVKLPKSLVNIYKELQEDLGITNQSGYLQPWAEQGVLLLNNVLTVESGQAASHAGKGWERFTDKVIQQLNEQREGLVFVLWGKHAQKKGAAINNGRHLVLNGPHPSPLSAYRGFFGSKPFSKINTHLQAQGNREINWQL